MEEQVIMKRCLDEILMDATDDWLYEGWIAGVAQETGGAKTNDETRDLSVKLIGELVGRRLMELGDLVKGKGFCKWKMPISASLERVETKWKALGRRPRIGEICWLRNTKAGDLIAERLIWDYKE